MIENGPAKEKLNPDHLFDDGQAAGRFRSYANERVPEHARF